jgi:hypothetical protein
VQAPFTIILVEPDDDIRKKTQMGPNLILGSAVEIVGVAKAREGFDCIAAAVNAEKNVMLITAIDFGDGHKTDGIKLIKNVQRLYGAVPCAVYEDDDIVTVPVRTQCIAAGVPRVTKPDHNLHRLIGAIERAEMGGIGSRHSANPNSQPARDLLL